MKPGNPSGAQMTIIAEFTNAYENPVLLWEGIEVQSVFKDVGLVKQKFRSPPGQAHEARARLVPFNPHTGDAGGGTTIDRGLGNVVDSL